MPPNSERRRALLDAAIAVLGERGGRGLTHRAVDTAAELPQGSAANYFKTRELLVLALAERIFERLALDADRLGDLEAVDEELAPSRYVEYALERLLADRSLALALVEVRLEAARSPAVRELVGPFLRGGFADDVAFHARRGLPGGSAAVAGLHHIANGVLLDALTVPLRPDADPLDEARRIAESYVRGGRADALT